MAIINQFETTVEVGTTDTEIGPFLNRGVGYIANLDFSNANGGQALTTCKIQTRATADSPWRDYFGGSDWASTTDSRKIFAGSTSPATLAAGAGTSANIIVCGVDSIRIIATTGSGTANLTVRLSWAQS